MKNTTNKTSPASSLVSTSSAAVGGGFTLGLDLGDRQHHVCVLDVTGQIVREAALPNTRPALKQLLADFPHATVALEAGTHSPWISRFLAQLGAKVFVANPRKLHAISRSERKCDRRDAQMLGRLRHDQGGQITLVRVVPAGFAGVTKPQPQEETFESIARFAQVIDGGVTGAHQVSNGFVLLIGDVNGGEFPRAKQARELIGIAPVGLHLVGSLLGNERRRNQIAMDAFGAQMAAQDKAAGTGFVNHAQIDGIGGKFFNELVHGIKGAADDALTADFGGVLRGDGNGDGILVDVHADVLYDFVHGCLVLFNCYQCRGVMPGV